MINEFRHSSIQMVEYIANGQVPKRMWDYVNTTLHKYTIEFVTRRFIITIIF